MFWETTEVHMFNLSSPNCIWWLQLWGLVSFSSNFCFQQNLLGYISLKFNYCGKIFMSIQIVLNVWEQFEFPNLDIFELQWTLVTYFFFIQCPFPIMFFGQVAHTSLVCVAKSLDQSKKLWVTKKHFSRRRFSEGCVFCNCFLTFQIHYANSMRQLNDIFFRQFIFMMVLKHFVAWSFFIWLGLDSKLVSKCVSRKIPASFFHTKTL